MSKRENGRKCGRGAGRRAWAGAVLAAAAAGSSASAAVITVNGSNPQGPGAGGANAGISVNFASGTGRTAGAVYGVTGPAGIATLSNWNNPAPTASNAALNFPLVDSNNAAPASTPAVASVTFTNTYAAYAATQADQNLQLLNAYLDNTNTTANFQNVVVNNVPYSSYAVIAYVSSDNNGRAGHVTIGSTSYYYNTYGVNPVGLAPTAGTSAAVRPYANYAVFDGQTAASFTLSSTRDNNNNGLAGFQVVPTFTTADTLAVTGDGTIDVSGIYAATYGGTTIGTNTLSTTGAGIGGNSGYAVTLGATTLSGNPTFNVANGGTGVGILNLGAIADGGTARTITKAGTGRLQLNADATSALTATLNVTGGSVYFAAAAPLGAAPRVNLGAGTTATLSLSQTFASLNGISAAFGNVVTLPATTLTVGNAENLASAYGGVISGAGGLTKAGTGVLSLTGNNTYTGPTAVNAGILAVGGGNSAAGRLPTGSAVAVNNGGTIRVDSDNALGGFTPANIPAVTLNAGGTLTMANGVTTHVNALALTGGTLASGTPSGGFGSYNLDGNVTGGGVTATSTITAADVRLTKTGGVTFTINSGATNGIDLDVTGTGYLGGTQGLVKAGTGVMRLSTDQKYTGTTTVTGGTLLVATANALATSTGVSVSAGALTSNVAAAALGGPLTLSGTGSFNPDLAAVGSVTLPNGTAFTMSGGTWAQTITGTTAYDQVIEAAGATPAGFTISGGTLDLTGSTISYAQAYPILTGFDPAGSAVSGLTITGYDTANYVASLGTSGVLSFAPVPEPATAGLFALGLTGLLARRRRR